MVVAFTVRYDCNTFWTKVDCSTSVDTFVPGKTFNFRKYPSGYGESCFGGSNLVSIPVSFDVPYEIEHRGMPTVWHLFLH